MLDESNSCYLQYPIIEDTPLSPTATWRTTTMPAASERAPGGLCSRSAPILGVAERCSINALFVNVQNDLRRAGRKRVSKFVSTTDDSLRRLSASSGTLPTDERIPSGAVTPAVVWHVFTESFDT